MNFFPFCRLTALCLAVVACLPQLAAGQEFNGRPLYCTEADSAVFERFLFAMEGKRSLPAAELTLEVARFFVGSPYVGATLEREPEGLVVNLREFDCTTFVETVYALTRMLRGDTLSFDAYCRRLQALRYRDGAPGDYTDRLHYTSDWLYENGRKGILDDVTHTLGGVPHPLALSFMSTHPGSYPALKDHTGRIILMAEKEKEINARTYYIIPKADIDRLAGGMRDGDLVCFVTSIGGLDISHVGILCRTEEGTLSFFHASSSAGKVILNKEPLSAYTQQIQRTTGVMVARMR